MTDELTFELVAKMCLEIQKKSISKAGSVGAVVRAINFETKTIKYFSAANLYFNESFVADHAEQLALKIALLQRYYPLEVIVTSSRPGGEPTFLCGICREFIIRINKHLKITVINPDGTLKGWGILKDQLNNYNKPNILKLNREYKKLCGYKEF